MLSSMEFVRQSLEIHLFFARIMKEHSFFLQTAFTSRDINFIAQADRFRMEFDRLLGEVVSLSNGVVSPDVLLSGEVFTQYTLNAEMASSYFTGVQIPTGITQAEAGLMGGGIVAINRALEERVSLINQRAMGLLAGLIQFKASILSNVLTCKMFTNNYPLLIDHIMREAKLYLRTIQKLQNRENLDIISEAMAQELFWNKIMAEHAKFIRGLLDPTEEKLFDTANNFGNEFDKLTEEAKAAMDMTVPFTKVTDDSLKATEEIRNFKVQGTEGILQCKIKSIIIPLLADHTVREASHFLRLLKTFKKQY
ncbi:DUF2935 domain-containing protein [Acetivibrio cellulolyticus]|uniref:DUF2935 domain-containing protein n=1 Tax=Acetivibrio cellulolyticus TaxID=35830 RepID=UPI0001E2C7CF|nr:DUF2935 domain-containing protein [Acetivibrio cellulolyticus]